MASVKFIRDRARNILKEFGVTEPPVPIREIIDGYVLRIEEIEGNESYEGELIPERRLIRINSKKIKTRQRFTLAHELGHWVLYHQHRMFENEDQSSIVEQQTSAEMNFFDEDEEPEDDVVKSDDSALPRTTSRSERDREANIFAAEILMPTKWVKADWKQFGPDVSQLASRYKVSEQAMWHKVMDLRLIK